MGRLSKGLRFEILARDGFRCRYCGVTAESATLHVDHVVPRSMGGRDDAANLVAACSDCNMGKSDRAMIAAPVGFALTPDKRPERMAKMRASKNGGGHVLDCSRIEEFDELNDDTQLCWVWCRTHKKLEWHSLPLDYAETQDGIYHTDKKAVIW